MDTDTLEVAKETAAYVIGLAELDAVRAIQAIEIDEQLGRADRLVWRVLSRDGQPVVKTNDYKPWRINLHITEGIVERAYPG